MKKNQIYEILVKKLPEKQVKLDEPMKKHTNFKIGGNADIFITAKKNDEILTVLKLAKENDVKLTILGNGSNVLVSDEGIRGVVLKISIPGIDIKKEKESAIITVGAGEPLGKVAYTLLNEEIAGFEFASGIPGTMGGAIRMNAGAYGGEMKDCIKNVIYIDENGNLQSLSNKECDFSYRHSIFFDRPWIIVNAELELPYGNKQEIKEKIDEYAKSRREKQPINFPSAGSTFKRGTDFITAKLIDEAGLKGYSIGGAEVSSKHAGFIINKGNATAKDILELIEYVKHEVEEKLGKQIELEIEILC